MIVVIEDSATQRIRLERDVRAGGWEVRAAEDGESGLRLIRDLDPPPLAVVTDIVMPGRDGWEVCRGIKEDPRLQQVAVIVLTELSHPSDVLRAVVAGADNYCTKPYEPDTLVHRIRQAIEQVRSGDAVVESEGERFEIDVTPPRLAHIFAASLQDAALRYRELADSRSELAAAYADRESMTRVIVHELRSPLQAILAAAQISQRRPEILHGLPALVERQAQRMSRIVEDLSDLTKIELGQLSIETGPREFGATLRETLDRIRPSLPEHRIIVDVPSDPLPVRIDVDRIEQVLINLLTNAAKYSPGEDRVAVTARRQGPVARVEIRDWGVGVPEEARERIFDRYFRTDTGAGTIEGLGVGLYLTRHLVRAHGGEIGILPAPDRGSIFWFELPLDLSSDPRDPEEDRSEE